MTTLAHGGSAPLCLHECDRSIDVIDSATEQVYFRVPEAQPADIDRAVTAARRAFEFYAGLDDVFPFEERAQPSMGEFGLLVR
ncbi:MAG: aldehyde dehydrogenase family protein [Acidimicrobiales bacterium]